MFLFNGKKALNLEILGALEDRPLISNQLISKPEIAICDFSDEKKKWDSWFFFQRSNLSFKSSD